MLTVPNFVLVPQPNSRIAYGASRAFLLHHGSTKIELTALHEVWQTNPGSSPVCWTRNRVALFTYLNVSVAINFGYQKRFELCLSESLFRFWLGLVTGEDFCSNILRFLGQSQFPEAGHVGPNIGRLVRQLFEGLRALLGTKPLPGQSLDFRVIS
jgi:hypothetical protein